MGFFSGLVGGLLGGGGSKSSSSQSSSVTDQRIGAEGGSSVARIEGIESGAIINVGSDNVAEQAIDAVVQTSVASLEATNDFFSNAFQEVLKSTEGALISADKNIAANRQITSNALSKSLATPDDRIVKILGFSLLAGVSIFAFKSGAFK